MLHFRNQHYFPVMLFSLVLDVLGGLGRHIYPHRSRTVQTDFPPDWLPCLSNFRLSSYGITTLCRQMKKKKQRRKTLSKFCVVLVVRGIFGWRGEKHRLLIIQIIKIYIFFTYWNLNMFFWFDEMQNLS